MITVKQALDQSKSNAAQSVRLLTALASNPQQIGLDSGALPAGIGRRAEGWVIFTAMAGLGSGRAHYEGRDSLQRKKLEMQIINLFAFLSVIFRAATIMLQSLVLGGVVFSYLVLGQSGADANPSEANRACERMLRIAAIILVVVQALYISCEAVLLVELSGFQLGEIAGASFFLAMSTSYRVPAVSLHSHPTEQLQNL
jgi:hypothetical protein